MAEAEIRVIIRLHTGPPKLAKKVGESAGVGAQAGAGAVWPVDAGHSMLGAVACIGALGAIEAHEACQQRTGNFGRQGSQKQWCRS